MITKKQRNKIKKEIIAELTDSKYGIFNKSKGYAVYNGTDLDMVCDCVQRALTRLTDEDQNR